jgi:hypothetical protein
MNHCSFGVLVKVEDWKRRPVFISNCKLQRGNERNCGLGSVVSIATGYGLVGPGIESRWGRDFPHLSKPALGPTQPPVQCVPVLSRAKGQPGRDTDPSPPSSAVVEKV